MDACRAPDGEIEASNTSGSLIEMKTLEQHGLLVDGLFIDGVDHELSLRLRAAGLQILECQEALLLHSPGDSGGTSVHPEEADYDDELFSDASLLPGAEQGLAGAEIPSDLSRIHPRANAGFVDRGGEGGAVWRRTRIKKLSAFCRGWWDGLRGHLGKRY